MVYEKWSKYQHETDEVDLTTKGKKVESERTD